MSEPAPDWLGLFDDEREEPKWLPPRKEKLGQIAVREAFFKLGGRYRGLAWRMRECGDFLEFACYRIGDSEEIVRRLVKCNRCRVRLCFFCERAKARKRYFQVCEIVTGWFKKRPTDQAGLLTLTILSVEDDELRGAIDHDLESFRRLTRSAPFKRAVGGWFRSLEVTRNAATGLWHAHLHVLLIFTASYFRRARGIYLDQPQWAALWRKCARLNYDPIVDIRALKGVGGGLLDDVGRKSLAEVTKYCTKPSDLVQFDDNGEPLPVDPKVLKTLYDALRGRRLTGMSGSLRAIANELGQVDPDDDKADLSIAEQIPDGAVYLGREAYRWHAGAREYLRVPYAEWQSPAQEAPMQPP